MIGRGGSAAVKGLLGPLKQLPGIIEKGADVLVGKEARTDSRNLKGVDAIAGPWDTATFEGRIQDAFKEAGARSVAGSGYFVNEALQTLQKAVDGVLSKMVEAGNITREQSEQVRHEYNINRLRDASEARAVDTNPTDDRQQ